MDELTYRYLSPEVVGVKAILFDKGRVQVNPRHPTPSPHEDEALVSVIYAGICGTDLEIKKGYYSFQGIPGHEFVGIVEKSVRMALVGKRVVGEINITCQTCSMCSKGASNHCLNRSVLGIKSKDGAFAEYLTLPIRNLHLVPDSVSDTEAVFTEPLAAAYEVLEQVNMDDKETILILGDGRLGILIAQVIRGAGKVPLLAGHHESKLSLARKLGIECIHESELNEDARFDVVIDATGSADGLACSLKYIRPRGTVVLKSTVVDRSLVDISKIVVNEVLIVGSRCGPFGKAVQALTSKKVRVEELISRVFPIDEAEQAFDYAEAPETLKVLLKMQ